MSGKQEAFGNGGARLPVDGLGALGIISPTMTAENATRVSPTLAGWAEWLTAPRFACLLAVLIGASFPDVLFGGRTFVVRDFGFFAYPLAHFQRECFWRGELPLWNPLNNCGIPFLAQWNTMCLYPLSLIYLVLPLSWSLSFFSLLHLFIAGLGAYRLGLRWTGSRFGAAVAGLAFAFNGLSLNMLMWPSHIATLAWTPWLVLAAQDAWREGGRKLLLAGLIGTLQMLAGGPETIMLTWLFIGAVWLLEIGQTLSSRQAGRLAGVAPMLWRLPLLVLCVTALSAAQLFPFLDLVAHSQREQGYADTRWSMPGWGWANFLVPMVFGHVWNMGVFFQYDQSWTSSYYLGIGVMLLALLAVASRPEARVRLLAAIAIGGFLLALGQQSFVYLLVKKLLPQLSLITYPIKFVTIVVFVMPLLAAYAVSSIEEQQPRPGRVGRRLIALGAVLMLLIGGILWWASTYPFPTDDVGRTLWNGITRVGFLVAIVGLLFMMRKLSQARFQRVLPCVVLLLFWLDIQTHEPPQNPTVPTWVYQPGLARSALQMNPDPAVGKSRVMVTPAAESRFITFVASSAQTNFLVKRLGYFADCNVLDDVPKVNGFFSLYPREFGYLNSVIYSATNIDFSRLQDFMSVSQVTASGKYAEWTARATYMPMVTAGQQPVVVSDEKALQILAAPDIDLRKTVLLTPRSPVTITNGCRTDVLSTRFDRAKVELEVKAEAPALVVVSQAYYHNWRAFVDGKPSELLRANYGFQAVAVPAGQHRVNLVYEDRAFKRGFLLAGIALAGYAAVYLGSRMRRGVQRGENQA